MASAMKSSTKKGCPIKIHAPRRKPTTVGVVRSHVVRRMRHIVLVSISRAFAGAAAAAREPTVAHAALRRAAVRAAAARRAAPRQRREDEPCIKITNRSSSSPEMSLHRVQKKTPLSSLDTYKYA